MKQEVPRRKAGEPLSCRATYRKFSRYSRGSAPAALIQPIVQWQTEAEPTANDRRSLSPIHDLVPRFGQRPRCGAKWVGAGSNDATKLQVEECRLNRACQDGRAARQDNGLHQDVRRDGHSRARPLLMKHTQ